MQMETVTGRTNHSGISRDSSRQERQKENEEEEEEEEDEDEEDGEEEEEKESLRTRFAICVLNPFLNVGPR
ncbi:hypothetical protein K0M31_002817 [Melipona bicolor]|uniref:Uncharacterized protein n=1 Tax=Melipona bicolor TaxID=60889 RepID=A0AA40KPU5_9HYME|nr:hypothetical protein K0M31_002817 [Melipona bicolor]